MAPLPLFSYPALASSNSHRLMGLRILQLLATRSAGAAGVLGRDAATALTGSTFDLRAADALVIGAITLQLSALDMDLSVLPLLPLALDIWFDKHSPSSPKGCPAILTAALALNFTAIAMPRPL